MGAQAERGLSTSFRPLRDSAVVWGLLLAAWLGLGGVGTARLWVSDFPKDPPSDFGILSKFADHLGSREAGMAVQQRVAGLSEDAAILFIAPARDWTATEIYDALRYSAWPRKVHRVELESGAGTPASDPGEIDGPIAAVFAYRVALPPPADPRAVIVPVAPQLFFLETAP